MTIQVQLLNLWNRRICSTMMRNQNPKAKSLRANRGGTRKSGQQKNMKVLELKLLKSYPGQAIWQHWLAATPVKYTTTVTSGLIAQVFQITITNISGFSTRFASTFVEYRIIRARFRIRLFSSTNSGVLQFWIDEKSATAPALNEALERATLIKNASAIDSQSELLWECTDTLDLQYQAIGTAYTPATFKVYTNNTNFGSSIVATDYVEIEPLFQVQFRGLQGV